MLSLVARSWGQ